MNYAKTAEPIEMRFAEQTHVSPMNHVLDRRHLANTTEPSVIGGDTGGRRGIMKWIGISQFRFQKVQRHSFLYIVCKWDSAQ